MPFLQWSPGGHGCFIFFVIDPDINVKSLLVKFSDDIKVCEVANNGDKKLENLNHTMQCSGVAKG